MNVLVVYTHPVKTSFNRALLGAVEQGLADAGHVVKVADLYAEDFQCAIVPQDFASFDGLPMPPEILAEQARVEWCDAMIYIFPIYWWSMPAMLKGWIDRVMSYGWAWVDPRDPDSGTLARRKILVLATAGDSAEGFAKRGYDTALRTQLDIGTWDYCGFKDVTTRIFHEVGPDAPKPVLQAYLEDARSLAASL